MPNQYTRRIQGRYASISARKLDAILVAAQGMSQSFTEDEVRDILINYDWPNAGEHQEWLDREPSAKVADWALDNIIVIQDWESDTEAAADA